MVKNNSGESYSVLVYIPHSVVSNHLAVIRCLSSCLWVYFSTSLDQLCSSNYLSRQPDAVHVPSTHECYLQMVFSETNITWCLYSPWSGMTNVPRVNILRSVPKPGISNCWLCSFAFLYLQQKQKIILLAAFALSMAKALARQTEQVMMDRQILLHHPVLPTSALYWSWLQPDYSMTKNRKQELNKDSLSTSKTFGFRLSFVPFKSIILKNVYAAEAFLLHIKILEKQEKEINASFKINHCWHSLECVTVIHYCAFTFVHIYKILHLILKLSYP